MISFTKNKERIRQQLKKDWKEYVEISEQIGHIKCNDLGVRFSTALSFGALFWGVGLFVQPILLGSGIPLEIIQPLSVAIPVITGIASEEGLLKILKNKERLRKISNATTQQERVEDATKLEIKKEKLLGRIKVLEKTYEIIEKKERMAEYLPSTQQKYIDDTRSIEELNENIESLEDLVSAKIADIEVVSTKKVLKDKFWREREKGQKSIDLSVAALAGLIIGLITYNMSVIIDVIQGATFSTGLIEFIAPGIIAGTASTAYYIKKNKDYTKAFKKINKEELGKNAIFNNTSDNKHSRKLPNNKIERFDLELESLISETADMVFLQEEERSIIEFKSENLPTTPSSSDEKDFAKSKTPTYANNEVILNEELIEEPVAVKSEEEKGYTFVIKKNKKR